MFQCIFKCQRSVRKVTFKQIEPAGAKAISL